jgi:hypothetical protein
LLWLNLPRVSSGQLFRVASEKPGRPMPPE